MSILLSLLAVAAGTTVALTGAQTIVLDVPRIRLADVAVPAGLPRSAWDRLARQVIATIPARHHTVMLSRKALSVLITRRAPGVRALAGTDTGPVRFEVRSRPAGTSKLDCRVLGLERRANEQVNEADLVPAPCTANRPAFLRFDREDHRLAATHDLPAGSYLGRVAVPAAAAVKRGDDLRLVSKIGPVTIERAVTAVQPGHDGRRVFVRDPDGQVFAVKLDQAEAGR